MTLAPLLDAPATVIAHTLLAVTSVCIGGAVIVMRKGTPAHVALGRLWAAMMICLAALSFVMTGGRFSWIHILSIVTLTTVPIGIWRRRQGDIRAHAITMLTNYAGLVIAGAFTIVPGRIMHRVFWG